MGKNKQHQRKGKSTLKNLLALTQKAQAAADAQAKRDRAKLSQAAAVKKAASGGAGKKKRAATEEMPGGDKTAKKVRRPKIVKPTERDDTVLLVGEGNFSFAHALLLPPHNHPAHLLIATAYDTEAECYEKYPDAVEHVSAIRRAAGSDDAVLFGIDAGSLDISKPLSSALSRRSAGPSSLPSLDPTPKKQKHHASFSKVIFNFPHVGQGHKDEARNVAANQLMLGRFLCAVAPLLSQGAAPEFGKKKIKGMGGAAGDQDEGEGGEEEEMENEDSEDEDGLDGDVSPDEADPSTPGQGTTTSVKPWRLPPNRAGSILVTLRNCKPYILWDVPRLAKQLSTLLPRIAKAAPALPKGQSLPSALISSTSSSSSNQTGYEAPGPSFPRFQLWRSWEFDPTAFEGYEHRRTLGFVPGLSAGGNEDILRSVKKAKPDEEPVDAGQEVRKSRAGGGECRTWQFGLLAGAER